MSSKATPVAFTLTVRSWLMCEGSCAVLVATASVILSIELRLSMRRWISTETCRVGPHSCARAFQNTILYCATSQSNPQQARATTYQSIEGLCQRIRQQLADGQVEATLDCINLEGWAGDIKSSHTSQAMW